MKILQNGGLLNHYRYNNHFSFAKSGRRGPSAEGSPGPGSYDANSSNVSLFTMQHMTGYSNK